jgi:hypothetical protein
MSSEGFDHDILQDLRNKIGEDLLIIYPNHPGDTCVPDYNEWVIASFVAL